MKISIPSILIALGGKCLLNWVMVVSQKKGSTCRGFMGVFGVSLALVDTILTLTLTALHVQADGVLLGVRLTRHHVCLLSQLAGQIYGSLQWPVVVLGGLDCYLTVRGQGTSTTTTTTTTSSRLQKVTTVPLSALLWCSAVFYVFLLSDFYPVLGEEPPDQLHRCWVSLSSQALHVGMVIVLVVACALVYSHKERRTVRRKPWLLSPRDPLREMDHGALSRGDIVRQALMTLLHSWAWFLVLLVALLLLLPFGIPGYLSLNVPWLCFLNSALTAVVLSASCPASRLARGLAAFPLDSFCDWRLGCATGT